MRACSGRSSTEPVRKKLENEESVRHQVTQHQENEHTRLLNGLKKETFQTSGSPTHGAHLLVLRYVCFPHERAAICLVAHGFEHEA